MNDEISNNRYQLESISRISITSYELMILPIVWGGREVAGDFNY